MAEGVDTGRIPTWDQIACYTQSLKRLPALAFVKRGGFASPPQGSGRNYGLGEWTHEKAAWDRAYDTLGLNVSPASVSASGIHAWKGADLEYPLTPSLLDLKLRSVMPAFLVEKSEGRRIHFQDQWPPNTKWPRFEGADDFQQWNEQVFQPQTAMEAKAAEAIKAEYYDPFPIEVEVMFSDALQPDLAKNLTTDQLVALAQEFITSTRNTVRPLYHGTLVAQSYARYDVQGDAWANLSFKGFDQVGFTIFPSCSLGQAQSYLDSQFGEWMKMVRRDHTPWFVGEMDVLPSAFASCGNNLADFEADLYRMIFSTIDAQPVAPVGINGPAQTLTSDAFNVVNDYYHSH